MVLAILHTIVSDIMQNNKEPQKCSERRRQIIEAIDYFAKTFGVSVISMKNMAIETILYFSKLVRRIIKIGCQIVM